MNYRHFEKAADLLEKGLRGSAIELQHEPGQRLKLIRPDLPPLPVRFVTRDRPVPRASRTADPHRAIALDVLILPRASQEQISALRAAGRSFIALRGTLRIQAPGLLIDRNDLKPAASERSGATRSPFSDRASLIARTLFRGGREQVWTLSELAEKAGVALATASYVTRELALWQIIVSERVGRKRHIRLRSRRALLSRWTRAYDWRDNTILPVDATMPSIVRFLTSLTPSLGSTRWAATLHAGASLLELQCGVERLHVYVDVPAESDLEELAYRNSWRPNPDGALVLLIPYYRESLWRHTSTVRGVEVVSPLQLILDLWHHEKGGREYAGELIKRRWLTPAQHDSTRI